MPIPDYETIMLPLLKFAEDDKEHSLREAIEYLAKYFNLTDEERKELLPSGRQFIFDNRVGWACTYLKKAVLLESVKRGYFKITERGIDVLKRDIKKITPAFLEEFQEFKDFKAVSRSQVYNKRNDNKQNDGDETPEEKLENAYQIIRKNLAQELIQKVMKCSPSFFETLVIDLLISMGYGGSRIDAGKAIGKSGDEGIDGIIKEDRLGLDTIYIQAKRWENQVGRPEIQKFAGALLGQKAKKGIFITTSSFTKEAINYAESIENKIVLIDGEQLANFMIDFNIGVSKVGVYEVKKIDNDYFADE